MSQPVDLACFAYGSEDNPASCRVFAGPVDAPISRRFVDAVSRGEVTKGGMAEAGWFDLGRIEDDGLRFHGAEGIEKQP